jgi:hypothetical protein
VKKILEEAFLTPKEYLRTALRELLGKPNEALLPQKLFELYKPMMTACQSSNDANAMLNTCCGMCDILEHYLNQCFARDGLDAECIAVRDPDYGEHNYNLVRFGSEILIVDGGGGQYIPNPVTAFGGLFAFIGTRAELKALVISHAMQAFASGEGFTEASLGTLAELNRRTRSENPEVAAQLFWEAAWGDRSIFVKEKYRPLNPDHHDLWKRELFFDKQKAARDFARVHSLEYV